MIRPAGDSIGARWWIATALTFGLAAPPSAVAGDWAFYRHDLSGTSNAGEPLSSDQARALEVRRYLVLGADNASNPIVAQGMLYYTAGDGFLHAIDLGTFSERWRKNLIVKAPFPACIDMSSMGPVGAPAVVGGTVYVPSADGFVYALDARSGTQLWATQIADVHGRGDFLWSSSFPVKDKIYVGVASLLDCALVPGRIVQLDQATGAVTGTWWADPDHGPGGGVWTQQAYDPVSNRLFATTGTIADGKTTAEQPWADAFVAIDPDSMQTVDALPPIDGDNFTSDVDFGASPTLYDSPDGRHFIAATDKNGFVYAADRDNLAGGVVWSYQISGGGASPTFGEGSIVSAPYADGTLYVGGARTADNVFPGAIAALDAFTGQEKWVFHPEGFVLPGMTIAGDVLFAGVTDPVTFRGQLIALDRSTGTLLYQLAIAATYGEMTWANGALYVGDGIGGMYELVPNPAGPQPDFDLQLNLFTGQVVAGNTGTFTATVIPKNGFAEAVTLSVVKPPFGATASFDATTVGPTAAGRLPPYTSTLSVTAGTGGPVYDLAVITASGGGRTRSSGMWVQTSDFAVSGTAAIAVQGSTVHSRVTITPHQGFADPVSLTVTGLPAGVSASFDTNPATTQSTLTFVTSASAVAGTYNVQVTGTDGSLTRTCTVPLTLTPPADFRMQVSDPSHQVALGGQGTYEIVVSSTSTFSSQISFSVAGLPPGATASFTSGTTPDTETLTVSLRPDTPAGPWTLSITAQGGGLTRTASALLTVVPEFDLVLANASASVPQNGSTSWPVRVSPRNGFSAPVDLTIQGLPSGVTANFTALSDGSSTLALSASSSAPAGTYAATVIASSGGWSQSANLSVDVVPRPRGGCGGGIGAMFAPGVLALLFRRPASRSAFRERSRRRSSKEER